MTTVETLKSLYIELGGKLTDTYDEIADGAAVGNYTVIPDCIAALAEIAGGSIELPVVTQADAGDVLTVGEDGKWTNAEPVKELPATTSEDAGDVLTVGEDGKWAKNNGLYGAGTDTTLNTSGGTNIPLPNINKKKNAKIVFDATLSGTTGLISIYNIISIQPRFTNFKVCIDIEKIESDKYLISCGQDAFITSISDIVTGLEITPRAITFTSGKATVYMK